MICEAARERKRIEGELRAANGAKDEFVRMLSHELRNPTAPIRNALFVLEHADPAGDRARRAREIAGRQIAHLTRMVNDLLDVSGMVSGTLHLRRRPVDAAVLARRAGEDYRAVMEEHGLQFAVEVSPEPLWIDADDTRLVQIIGNLLHNAAKFTPAGGQVTLSAAAAGSSVEIRVSDSGRGLGPELAARLFEPFVQAAQPPARTEGGLGLGLALVKRLVEMHGGEVVVTSEGQGLGARFTVRLPRLPETRASRHPLCDRVAPEPEGNRDRTPRVRVLVVDDSSDAAESLAELVRVLATRRRLRRLDRDPALHGRAARCRPLRHRAAGNERLRGGEDPSVRSAP
jgi:signal transduction histidine kinase